METPVPKTHFSAEQAEKAPDFHDLVAYTTTFYDLDASSAIRQELALKMLQNAHQLGVRVITVDGGSNPDFLRRAQALDNVVVVEDPSLGMGQSRREALRAAMKSVAVPQNYFYLWLEPEKEGLMDKESLTKLLRPLRGGMADIVVPERGDKNTMPRFQAWIESRANERAMKTLGENAPIDEVWDFWFGPKIFNAAAADFFLNYKGELDKWDSIIKPVADAFKNGKRVVPVTVNFNYTEGQREQEESRDFRIKRIQQYVGILAEMGDSFWQNEIKER